MQFTMITNDLITDTSITSNEYRIYSYLLSRYNTERGCSFPSMETISEKLNISLSTVKRGIKRLADLNYITISKRKGLSGNYNIYQKLKHLIKNKVENIKKVEEEIQVTNVETPVYQSSYNEEESTVVKPTKQSKIDNHRNVRLARSVTDIDKSNFAKTVLTLADDDIVRDVIKNFKKKKGSNATFLIQLLVDEYYKCKIEFSTGLFNLLKSGLKDPFLTQPV